MSKWVDKLFGLRKDHGKRVVNAAAEAWALDRVAITFGKRDKIRLGQLYEGVGIIGGTGSGKTSGSGRLIARTLVAMHFGGIVLTAKREERLIWQQYCKEAGRLDDLIIFGPDQPWRFNFLDFEVQRGGGSALCENIVRLFMTVIEVSEKSGGGRGGEGGEQYWQRALKQLLRNLVDLLMVAKGRITVPDLYRVAISAPTSLSQVGSEAWQKSSFCFACLGQGDKSAKSMMQKEDFKIVADYFLIEWPCLSDKTRSVVLSTFTSMADVLNRGLLKLLFSGETNVTPLAVEAGKIIVIDLPVKEYGDVGLFANVLWKTSFQKSIERRDTVANPRGTFIWQDEAQLFGCDSDMLFQQTARASRVANVLLTQSISNFYAVSGDGQKGKAQVDSLWGNLNLKIFHANGDAATNLWAADMVGKSRQFFLNANSSHQTGDAYDAMFGGSGGQQSGGFSEQETYDLQPSVFSRDLRSGGPINKFLVDGILFSPVMCFHATGKNWMPVTFAQR